MHMHPEACICIQRSGALIAACICIQRSGALIEPCTASVLQVANSLKKYADAHRFEKAIRYQMATHMTSAELHRLRNVFERLDTDGTGHVSIGK